jgi:hypothetical protein
MSGEVGTVFAIREVVDILVRIHESLPGWFGFFICNVAGPTGNTDLTALKCENYYSDN